MATNKALDQPSHHQRALVLSGGGARAAYQVGVLKGIAALLPDSAHNPFGIISGTSAGALNAVALAAYADNFRNAVYNIEQVWRTFQPGHVYRSDPAGAFGNAARWLLNMFIGSEERAVALLDNRPLAELLSRLIHFSNIQEAIDAGYLRAVSVTASGYSSGHSVAFFEGAPDISAWKRFQRVGLRTRLKLDHLMASSAIPLLFPAVRVDREYFGDGAVRQLAPLSPALHMGARKVLIVGVSGNRSAPQVRKPLGGYPSLAQIGGHLMNSIFLDSLEYDVERLEHINAMLAVIPEAVRRKTNARLLPIDSLVISPSQSLDSIAAKYLKALPTSVRILLHGIGGTRSSGSNISSYLLFERHFCRELIELGYHDALAKAEAIHAFIAD